LNKINFTIILLLFFVPFQVCWAQPSWEDKIQLKNEDSKSHDSGPEVIEPELVEPKVSLPGEVERPEADETKENLPEGSDEDIPDMEDELD
jgi:hypothetical protein